MTKLHIADGLSLPSDAVTQTFAILAKRGVGKTYTASVMAEEMLKAKQQVVAIDPTGAWWGLRSAFPIVVLGGDHGDLPLEEHSGEVIASAIVENRFSAVLDLSLFRKGQLIRFMVTFAETLYRLNREALHLFVDEADAVAPQGRNFGGEENRMLGAMEDIVRRGRKRGIGCTLITQRPAVLNKNVLTQCESLFAMRLVHPRDIDAIMEWINVHAEPAQAKEVVESLPQLGIGEGWFWSPGWMNILKRVRIRKRETFDSSATPKPGEEAKQPKQLAALDLDILGQQIKATVQRAQDNDPRELKKRIAELEKQLRDRPAVEPEKIEVPVLKNGQLDKAHGLVNRLEGVLTKVGEVAGSLKEAIGRAAGPVAKTVSNIPDSRPAITERPRHNTPRPVIIQQLRTSSTAEGISGPEQRILDQLAELQAFGLDPVDKRQLALMCGYTNCRSGGFTEPLGAMQKAGNLDYPRPGQVRLTEEGLAVARPIDRPASTDELQRRILEKLDGPRARVLRELIAAYPQSADKTELAQRLGYTNPRSGGFTEPLGSLRELGLIDYPEPGRAVATRVLFLE